MTYDYKVFLRDCRDISTITELKSSSFALSRSTDSAVGGSEEINSQPDFNGFPSRPPCIFQTGISDHQPLHEQPQREEPRPVFLHPIKDSWHVLGKQVYLYLDSVNVKWSTIDPIRFAKKDRPPGALHLWIGVKPGSLDLEPAKAAAAGCKSILHDAGHPDVEIAFRESNFSQLLGPSLLSPVSTRGQTDDIDNLLSPFTPTLGLRIAPRRTPCFEATGGLYICEGGDSDRVFLLTVRHAALPTAVHPNTLYEKKQRQTCQPSHDIILLGHKAYTDAIDLVMAQIGRYLSAVDIEKDGLDELDAPGQQERQGKIAALEKTNRRLNKTAHGNWNTMELGDHTRDWASLVRAAISYNCLRRQAVL